MRWVCAWKECATRPTQLQLSQNFNPAIRHGRQQEQHDLSNRARSCKRLRVSHRASIIELYSNVKRSAIQRFELIYHVIEKDIKLLEEPQYTRLLNAQLLAEDLAIDLTEAYAQQCCRDLCAAMQRTLPRELRDMIYDHILFPARDEAVYIYGDCLDTIDEPHRGIIAAFAKPYGHAHMCSEDFLVWTL